MVLQRLTDYLQETYVEYSIWAIRTAGHADREPRETLQCEGGSEQQTLLGRGGLRWLNMLNFQRPSKQEKGIWDMIRSPIEI